MQIEISPLAARNIRSLIEHRFREELHVLERLEAEGADKDHIARVTMDPVVEREYRQVLEQINAVFPD